MGLFKKKIEEKHKISTDEVMSKGMDFLTSSGFSFDTLMKNMKKAERHVITIYPDMMDGEPSIDGHRIKVDEVACDWWNKKYDMSAICLVYRLQPGAVLTCCWYKARYGTEEWKKRWGNWLLKSDKILWVKDYNNCPLPPQKGDE